MEENNRQQTKIIDLNLVVKTIWENRRIFFKVLPIVFVLSCIYIFSLPRYYNTDAKLAPELGSSMGGGAIGSIASAFGFDFGDMQTTDAITPLLYPDLMEDNAFVANLFNIKVENKDKDIKTTYYDYIRIHQKRPWWSAFISMIKKIFKSNEDEEKKEFDPYSLSKKDDEIVKKISKNIKFSIDKKTGVITINVEDQDPCICKTLADSVMEKLQVFITEYRTNKARTDYEYYKQLASEAQKEYEKVRQKYASISDANSKVALRSIELKIEDMENDMQLKFNTYSTLNTQLQAAKAKVQERTPVFTVLKGAATPIKPAGPKRMLFVIGMMMIASIGLTIYLFFHKEVASVK